MVRSSSDYGAVLNGHATSDLPLTGGTISGNLSVSGNTTTTGWFRNTYAYSNTTSAAANLHINSNGTLHRSTASSRRYKHGICPLKYDLDAKKLLSVPVVQYVYNTDYLSEDDARYGQYIPGFIAEDIALYYPIAAETDDEGKPEDWNIRMVVPPMLALIQDAYDILSDHSSCISMLQTQIARQEAEIQALKTKLQH